MNFEMQEKNNAKCDNYVKQVNELTNEYLRTSHRIRSFIAENIRLEKKELFGYFTKIIVEMIESNTKKVKKRKRKRRKGFMTW